MILSCGALKKKFVAGHVEGDCGANDDDQLCVAARRSKSAVCRDGARCDDRTLQQLPGERAAAARRGVLLGEWWRSPG